MKTTFNLNSICKTCAFFLVLFFTLCTNFTISQNDSIKHSIGAEGSIYYGYRNLVLNNPSYSELYEFREAYEVAARGYAAGLKYRYQHRPKMGFEIGLSYNIRGYDASESTGFQDSEIFGGNAQYFYYFNYIDVPILFNYHFSDLRYNIFTSLGISTNYLLSAAERTVIVYSDNSISDKTEELDYNLFNRLNIQGIFRFGIDYTPDGLFTFRVVPVFQYSINDLTKNKQFNEHLFSAGLNLGVFFNF